MKKLLLSMAVLGSALAFSQQNGTCGFDQHNEMLHEQFPGSKEALHEQIIQFRDQGGTLGGDRAIIGVVPVVVHVIHDGGVSDISYDQIVSGIDQLNEDYQMLNPDAGNTRNTANAPFAPEAADLELEFKLARIDPNGNCTNGVERRFSPIVANDGGENAKSYNQGGLNAWPRDEYFNIWIVNTIDAGGGGGITLGYAQFPYFGQASTYGVLIRNDSYGTTGTATGDRTLTHELGHCFGLFHTFQDGCHSSNCNDNGDYCCDTPPVIDPQWSCGVSQNTCSQIPTNDTYGFDAYDQFENYMSYSPCQSMFSIDQRDIVQNNFSSIAWLVDLISPANAIATGVSQPDVLCKAEFAASQTLICAGSTIDFTDQSYFSVTGTDWTFDGGSPGTSTTSNPTVTYNTPGIYTVTLEVTDGTSTETTTEVAYITVLDNPGVALPYHDGFQAYTAIPDNQNWLEENEDSGEAWQLELAAGYYSTQAAMLDNFGQSGASKDHLLSGPIDLSGVDLADPIVFNFKYAYRKRSASNDEWLRFYISDDCGETWTLRKNIHGDELSPLISTIPYTPNDTDWVQVDITNINSPYYVSNFRFKFVFENDGGNNIYIDDINLFAGSMTSISESIADNLTVYPNPVTDQMDIRMDVYDTAFYTITMTNALGQEVALVYQGELVAGQGNLSYNTARLPAGIYFLNIESNGVMRTTKVMKK